MKDNYYLIRTFRLAISNQNLQLMEVKPRQRDIIVPPKLSDRTTPKVLIPSPVPTDMKPTTSIFDSIVKRSTANQFIVPPTIRSSDNVHLNLMVPPTISSSQTGNNAGNSQPSSQVVGILNSQPRVVCYADQPIDRDVPCPGDHNTSLGVQHMQSILKLMGGSDIKHTMVMKDPTVTPSTDLNNDDHSSASPVSRPNHTFPATPSEDTTDDAETMVRRVTNFLENRVTILEQLLDEANIDVIQCEENIEKLEKAIPTKRRKRRSIIGTSDVTCQSQGERIGGGNLLNLCSTCVQTTVLNENFFPRYITEKVEHQFLREFAVSNFSTSTSLNEFQENA
ncbi:hypothetical protein EGW08_006392 [Elysia chlorotica]|uniref:Uncharacterized protein n=1 Tax=Elysia chlorotica TaxID=188477 RepID=A0A433TW79_ELYCH|nr:hypothetical protein EGW08_006392 [Elysia chlorotica]